MNRTVIAIAVILFAIAGCKNEKPKFEKIIFHRSSCYGDCDAYHLEIKRDSSVRIFGENVYAHNGKMDYIHAADKEGYFSGKAKSEDFKKLDSIIQNIGIDTLRFDNVNCCDDIVYTIIVYYGRKRVELKSMTPPEHANDLIAVLSSICRNSDVKRTEEIFELESQKINGF